jgi:hypothetical protein
MKPISPSAQASKRSGVQYGDAMSVAEQPSPITFAGGSSGSNER